MMVSETFTLNTEAQLPDEGEGVCRMGKLFMVVLSLLGYWPVLILTTYVHGGPRPFVLKEYFDLEGRNCVIWYEQLSAFRLG